MIARTCEISNSDDIIDSRDVIARLEELASQYQDHANGGDSEPLDDDERAELDALSALAEEASDSPDWSYGEALIRESYFTEYAQQLADDIGAIDRNAGWLARHIDWEAVAEELKEDYFDVDFGGVTYLIRN